MVLIKRRLEWICHVPYGNVPEQLPVRQTVDIHGLFAGRVKADEVPIPADLNETGIVTLAIIAAQNCQIQTVPDLLIYKVIDKQPEGLWKMMVSSPA